MIRNSLNGRDRKVAGVTVELMLAITLAVVVLFFVLSIFGDNLKTMVASSGIQRMYANDQKTTYSTQKYDPTSVNVQVLAEQGNTFTSFQDAKDKAKAKVDGYLANPPQNEEQVLDLAKWATIAKIVGGDTIITLDLYNNFISSYGIHIYRSTYFATTVTVANIESSGGVNHLTINKQFEYNTNEANYNRILSEEEKLQVANEILNVQYSPL